MANETQGRLLIRARQSALHDTQAGETKEQERLGRRSLLEKGRQHTIKYEMPIKINYRVLSRAPLHMFLLYIFLR